MDDHERGERVIRARVKAPEADAGRVLDALRDCVGGHFDVEHSTFQIEAPEHRSHEGSLHA